jgi:hypothetical protein
MKNEDGLALNLEEVLFQSHPNQTHNLSMSKIVGI